MRVLRRREDAIEMDNGILREGRAAREDEIVHRSRRVPSGGVEFTVLSVQRAVRLGLLGVSIRSSEWNPQISEFLNAASVDSFFLQKLACKERSSSY